MASNLHCILRVGCLVYAAFAHRERSHADVLFQHVAVAEQDVLTVKLLLGDRCTTNNSTITNAHTNRSRLIKISNMCKINEVSIILSQRQIG